MNLQTRLRALTRRAGRMIQSRADRVGSVCDRIDELTRLYAENPPVFRPDIEASIVAAACRSLEIGCPGEPDRP